jgi:F-type H+-transporting ATPase subunit gamma
MAGLKTIKSKIRSIEKTETVTKAMEAVSAAKMRRAQMTALSGRAYAKAAVSILARVSGSQALARSPLTATRPLNEALYIVITSDKGLAGALNSAVLRQVQTDIARLGLDVEQVSIVAIGRKANDFFAARGYEIAAYLPNTDALNVDSMGKIMNDAAMRFIAQEADVVRIAYQHFVSTFEQRPSIRTVFPLSLEELSQVVRDIVPARGVFSDTPEGGVNPQLYTVEPSEDVVFAAILPKLANIFLHHALLESLASEHSARMVAMKSASDKAVEMQHALSLQFNKARQAAITREVSEITGGMEAMQM